MASASADPRAAVKTNVQSIPASEEIIIDPMKNFSRKEALAIGERLGINWDVIDLDEFHRGLAVELEHGSKDPETDVTHSDPQLTGKIAWAHLKEFPDYYTRLEKLETEADKFWSERRRQERALVVNNPPPLPNKASPHAGTRGGGLKTGSPKRSFERKPE